MPEYLAPGVYVEETSFRAKSIEGVGTSTTAFVGLTRKGPIASTERDAEGNLPPPPELLSSFGDFVRIYGGLEPLDFGGTEVQNHVALGVLNFFNEGGVRLYVSRVASGGQAAGLALAGDLGVPDSNNRVFLRARTPGAAGNGRITVREILGSATGAGMAAAPADTILRAAGPNPAEPARLTSTSGGPFDIPEGAVLRLMINGAATNFTFRGAHTEATGDADLADSVTLTDANHTLRVRFNGVERVVTLPNDDYTRTELALAINERLDGGYARLQGNRLVIGTDRRGHAGRVQVGTNAAFGFTAPGDQTGAFDAATNNAPNLGAATIADVAAVLQGSINAANVGGRLALSTLQAGENQTLSVADAADPATGVASAHTALGLTLPNPGDPAARGSNIRLFRKESAGLAGVWRADAANTLAVPADPGTVVGSFVSLLVVTEDASGESEVYDELSLAPGHPRFIGNILGVTPTSRADGLQRTFALDVGDAVNALALHGALFPAGRTSGNQSEGLSAVHTLQGGTDGAEPAVGVPTDPGTYAAALEQLRGLEDVSIIAAPGHSSFAQANYRSIQGALIAHASLPRAYRIAVLDTPANRLPSEAREERARIDSTRAAMYYPWVTVANPLARPGRDDIAKEINLPPSSFLCGIYARNDVEQGVSKAPANEVVRGALRFESDINFAQNQLLNPLGVNCLRYFPGRGYRVWGARTAGSDPEIKYVNVRRYLIYLEASIDRGIQWAVFENNGPRLWNNVRETIEAFLYNEWVSNNLLGANPKEAFFVRCDRSTMTQNDLDNGRLICLVGVALLKPAEFVIIRIGQKTADART
jgi:uncharacterized protein